MTVDVKKRRRRWSEREVEALATHFPDHGSDWDGWADVLPGRSEMSIQRKAFREGLFRAGAWTRAADGAMVRIVCEAAARLGKRPEDVARRANYLVALRGWDRGEARRGHDVGEGR